MAVDLSIAARDFKTFKKGMVISAASHPRGWGKKMILPDIIRVTVTDADLADTEPLMRPLTEEFTIEEVGDYIEITPQRVATIKKRIKAYLDKNYGGESLSLAEKLKIAKSRILASRVYEELQDKFADEILPRKFHIDTAVIDNFVANNIGKTEITKKQLQNNLRAY